MTETIKTLLQPIQNRLNAANDYPGPATIAESQEDTARLLAAVQAVVALAANWEARGEHDMAYSKTIPDEDIAMALLTDGATMVENARHIRNALVAALGGEA